jgi:hypothetical protein
MTWTEGWIPRSDMRVQRRRRVLATIIAMTFFFSNSSMTRAAEMAGVSMSDSSSIEGTQLVLNGIGLRTYSILGVHIYVAGLYLQTPSHDANEILRSSERKMLQIHFLHDVDVSDARNAWRTGLLENCASPCKLSPDTVARFLAALQPIHSGEDVTLLFGHDGLTAFDDGHLIGRVPDLVFSEAMLASFIGLHPATTRLKQELLGF